MNCISLHDNATGTEHLTTTVSDVCLDNLQMLEYIGEFKRFNLEVHSVDAPKGRTKYSKISTWLHSNAFYNMSENGIESILKTK